MKKLIFTAFLSLVSLQLSVSAADKIPAGYEPFSKIQDVIKESAGKKLIVLVIKGSDDKCPNCAEAMENGERAVGSGVMKVFARADVMNSMDTTTMPAGLQKRAIQGFTSGAWVTFLVFDPKMDAIIAESSRKELQSDKKLTAEFKKTVQDAKQKLK